MHPWVMPSAHQPMKVNVKKQVNFNDPRNQCRLVKALGFSRYNLSPDHQRAWHKKALDKVFGQQQNPVSKYLREKLLVCTREVYCFMAPDGRIMTFGAREDDSFDLDELADMQVGTSKAYLRGQKGYLELLPVIKDEFMPTSWKTIISPLKPCNTESISVLQVSIEDRLGLSYIADEHGPEIISGKFDYKDAACGRLTHPMQQISRLDKPNIWRHIGYRFDYDIATCAPTLLLQYARKKGFTKETHEYDAYLANRTAYRQQLADILGVSIKVAKGIITAIFNGARLSTSRKDSLMKLIKKELGYFDANLISLLKKVPFIESLRADIKAMWLHLHQTDFPKDKLLVTRHSPLKHSNTESISVLQVRTYERTKALTGSQRWSLYFRLERQVLNSIRNELESAGRVFFEHDGWRTDVDVSTEYLQDLIFQRTGFKVIIDKEEL
jgi:hypothetical protein